MPPTNWPLIWFGVVGGLVPDALRLIKNHHDADVPAYLKRFNFWLGLTLLAVLGGAAAWLLDANGVKTALACGYSAPQLLSKLLSKPPEGAGDRGDRGLGYRTWWAL